MEKVIIAVQKGTVEHVFLSKGLKDAEVEIIDLDVADDEDERVRMCKKVALLKTMCARGAFHQK